MSSSSSPMQKLSIQKYIKATTTEHVPLMLLYILLHNKNISVNEHYIAPLFRFWLYTTTYIQHKNATYIRDNTPIQGWIRELFSSCFHFRTSQRALGSQADMET